MNQTCKVCGEPAAGFHFGAFTCEGCKVNNLCLSCHSKYFSIATPAKNYWTYLNSLKMRQFSLD